jgi:hypothetical protein
MEFIDGPARINLMARHGHRLRDFSRKGAVFSHRRPDLDPWEALFHRFQRVR